VDRDRTSNDPTGQLFELWKKHAILGSNSFATQSAQLLANF
jgi:hypothetical protein